VSHRAKRATVACAEEPPPRAVEVVEEAVMEWRMKGAHLL
jgi:hypothetical protein